MAYNRKYAVEFETPGGKLKRVEGVDLKFKIEIPMSAVLTEATISICNLSRSDIEYLTTYTSKWLNLKERKRIRLYAGYEDEEPINLVFDGDITTAIPTQPPDVWLNCTALSGAYGSISTFSRSILVQSPIKSVFEQSATWANVEYEWNATSTKQISSFDVSGGYSDLIKALNDLGDITVFDENGRMIAVDADQPQRTQRVHEVSEKTGMVLIPKIDPIGAEIKTFLNTKFKRGETVNLTSSRIPIASGRYTIINIIHEGHYRGNAWYTTLKTRRVDSDGKTIIT